MKITLTVEKLTIEAEDSTTTLQKFISDLPSALVGGLAGFAFGKMMFQQPKPKPETESKLEPVPAPKPEPKPEPKPTPKKATTKRKVTKVNL